jgi:CBS domain-containing protein
MSLSRFNRPVVTIDLNDTVEATACTMRDERVGCVVVTDRGKPTGIVTDRDLALRVLAEGLEASVPIGSIATFAPLTVSIHDTVETASARMRNHGVRRLPIIDDDGRAVGIVTADDLLMLLGRELAAVCEGIENRSDAGDSR